MGEEEFDSEEVEVVYSEPETIEPKVAQAEDEPIVESHPEEGFLLRNPRSKVTSEELKMLRYLYKIPQIVKVQAPQVHERID